MPLAYCWCSFISCTLLHTTSKMWTSSSFGSECHLIRLLHFSSQFISCLQHSSPKGVLYSQNLSINLGVWEHLLFNYIWLILYHCIWFFTPNTHNWFEWSDHRSGAHTFYMCVIISWWFTHQTLLFKWCISDHKIWDVIGVYLGWWGWWWSIVNISCFNVVWWQWRWHHCCSNGSIKNWWRRCQEESEAEMAIHLYCLACCSCCAAPPIFVWEDIPNVVHCIHKAARFAFR